MNINSFDQLHQGDDYPMTKPAIHAGFLNFQPFPEFPQFHASYKLINEENGMVFSDKFHLNVIDLTHINLSTDADKEFQLDIWAKFFTAKTWEEVIMLAENNPYIDEAAQTLYEANADRLTQEQCRARRNYYKEKHAAEQELQKRDAIIVEQKAIILEKDVRIAELEAQLNNS